VDLPTPFTPTIDITYGRLPWTACISRRMSRDVVGVSILRRAESIACRIVVSVPKYYQKEMICLLVIHTCEIAGLYSDKISLNAVA
jgi:hypothetical protein